MSEVAQLPGQLQNFITMYNISKHTVAANLDVDKHYPTRDPSDCPATVVVENITCAPSKIWLRISSELVFATSVGEVCLQIVIGDKILSNKMK